MPEMASDPDAFEIVIHREQGRFVAAAPRSGVSVTRDSAGEALAALEALRAASVGAAAVDPGLRAAPARSRDARRIDWADIRQFAVKTAIVTVLVLGAATVSGTILLSHLQGVLRGSIDKLQSTILHDVILVQNKIAGARIGGGAFWARLEESLERAADPSAALPEEKQRKLLADIRTVVDRWRPFVNEVGRAFEREPSASGGAPPRGR